MTKKLIALGALGVLLTVGCGDDGATDGGTDTSTGDTSTGDTSTGDSSMDAATDTGAGGNACVNDNDPMALVNTHGDDDTPYTLLVTNCSLGCFGMGDDCTTDCIVAATDNPQIGRPCAACSAALSSCTVTQCLSVCPDPTNPNAECLACICEGAAPATLNCVDQYVECAGIFPADLCPAPSDGGTGDGGSDAAADGGSDAAADGGADASADAGT